MASIQSTSDRAEALPCDVIGDGPTIALVHGFTQTRRCWGPLREQLARHQRVVSIDAPGHGAAGHSASTLWEGADMLAATAGPATWIGYSMGGRLCLHLALTHPEAVESLVLIGAHPGIDDPMEHLQRRSQDLERADRVELLGTEGFLDEWLALPLFAGLTPETDCRADRLANDAGHLADSLRHAGTGVQDSLWGRLADISCPVLLVAGARDRKFRQVNEDMVAAIGSNAEVVVIPDTGHSAHLEDPIAFLAALPPVLA